MKRSYKNLETEHNAALNTFTQIAEALGSQPPVTTDTLSLIRMLVAENATLKIFITDECWVPDLEHHSFIDAVQLIPKTPATSEVINGYRAQGVEAFAREMAASNAKCAQGCISNRKASHYGKTADLARTFAAQLRSGQYPTCQHQRPYSTTGHVRIGTPGRNHLRRQRHD